MQICILAPLSLHEILDLIDEEQRPDVPEGLKFTVGSSLIRYYLQQGHKVVAITLDKTIQREKVFTGNNLTIYVGKYRNSSKIRALTQFHFEIKQMARFAKEHPCDIYHAHWEYEFALAALKLSTEKTVVTLHDWPYVVIKYLPGFYRYQRLRMSLKVFRKCRYFTTVSPYIRDLYLNFAHKDNICVIPNAVEGGLKELPTKRLNRSSPYLMAINNGFDQRKNVQNLIKAFKIIEPKIQNAELHLFGYGYGPGEAAQKWAEENGYSSRKIIYEGFRSHDEICDILRKADLLIHTSREESFGLIFLEAMQNGTPCVGGENSGAVRWVLDNGKAGVITDVESPSQIANDIIALINDENRWNKLRKYGFSYVHQRFSIEAVAEQYLAEYRTMLKMP